MLDNALEAGVHKMNRDKSRRVELVFFKEAIQHVARLSRVLVSVLSCLQSFCFCPTIYSKRS